MPFELVLGSLLPSAETIRFKQAVCAVIDRDDSSEIEWPKLEDLVVDCAGTSSAVFREHPFLVHKILPNHPPVSVVNAVVSARPECLVLLDSFQPEDGVRRIDATPVGIACQSGCSPDVIRFLIGKMVQLRSESKYERVFADFERDRAGGLFATTGFDLWMSSDNMKVLVEEHPDGILALSDNVGKTSLIAQLLLMRRSNDNVGRSEEEVGVEKYLQALEIVFSKETALGIPLPHAMLEVFTTTGRFATGVDGDNTTRISHKDRTDAREFTVQVQMGGSIQTSRDRADVEGERSRDYMLLDKLNIVQMLLLVRLKQPQWFKEADVYGRTLLHIVLSNPRNWKHAHTRTYGLEVVQYILGAYPEATSVKDREGRYPLQVAIENICPCYEIVLKATPAKVLESINPMSGLYLFQTPPKHLYTESQSALWTEISYRMLKKAPTLARGLAANPDPSLESDIFKKIQIAKMRREQESGRIAALERQLEQLQLSYRIGEND